MNNEPDYNDNLYFEEKMYCKNCPYTDEYCASGDCERDNNLTEKWKKGELPVGEYYYYTTIFSPNVYIQNFTRDVISSQDFKEIVAEVLAPVPSYEEYEQLENWSRFTVDYHALREAKEIADYEKVELLEKVNKLLDDNKRLKHDVGNLGYKIKNQRHEIERQIAQNAQLKDLLKESKDVMNMAGYVFAKVEDVEKAKDLIKKINEVLK